MVARRRLAVAGVALAVACVVTACSNDSGGSNLNPDTALPAHSESPSASSPEGTPSGRGSTPHVPGDYEPFSVTAISDDTFWVLGKSDPCDTPHCTFIVRTTDGGRTWTGVPTPPAPLSVDSGSRHGIRDLRFADEQNGFAFGPDLYVTHDGGQSWDRDHSLPKVDDLAAAAGRVFAVAGSHLFESKTSGGGWSPVHLPGDAHVFYGALALHGDDLWVLGGQKSADTVFHSSNGGASFTSAPSPCDPTLSGSLVPASSTVVWAVCATGMAAGILRSTDGGQHFSSVGGYRSIPNSTRLGARDDDVAFAGPACNGLEEIFANNEPSRTVIRGRCGGDSKDWSFVGFTDPGHGFALRGFDNSELWHTIDGGEHWRKLPI